MNQENKKIIEKLISYIEEVLSKKKIDNTDSINFLISIEEKIMLNILKETNNENIFILYEIIDILNLLKIYFKKRDFQNIKNQLIYLKGLYN